MVLFNNVIVKMKNAYMMMNLISFRRKIISEQQFSILKSLNGKIEKNDCNLTETEQSFYKELLKEKQILDDKSIKLFEEQIAILNKERKLKFNISNEIQINLADGCNFNCTYCYQKKYSAKNRVLSLEDIKNIKYVCDEYISKNSYSNNIKEVTVSGGESLMDSHLPLIWEISNVFDNSKLKILTNGVNISRLWDKLPYKKIKSMQVSLDGKDDVISKLSFGNKSVELFDSIVEGIERVLEYDVNVTINSIITKDTHNKKEELLSALDKRNILSKVKLYLSPVYDYGSQTGLDDSFYSKDEFIEIYNELKKLVAKYENVSFSSGLANINSLANLINRPNNTKVSEYRFNQCDVENGLKLVFAPDGKIYWCNKVVDDLGVVGKFKEDYYIDKELVAAYVNRSWHEIPECKKCEFKYICIGGCVLYNITNNNDLMSPACGCFKDEYVLDNLDKLL